MRITEKTYRIWLRLSITVVFLIIVAGAVVRMTGSGMGCPDWPKCFGYLIPPTEKADLLFKANTAYEEGMVIIQNGELKVANSDFTTGASYEPSQWTTYEKHNYSTFNKFHTWTEYINRLIGALGGIVVLIMAVFSIQFFRRQPSITWLSWAALLAMLIQAVIGKVVVDTVLSPVLITIHMVVALLIVGLLIYLLDKVRLVERQYSTDRWQRVMIIWIIVLTLIQVAMGTQVRQYIDEMTDQFGYPVKSSFLAEGPLIFYIHRSFSILLLILHGYYIYRGIKIFRHERKWYTTLGVLLAIIILSGVLMNYADFPLGSQAIHLVFASFLLGVQFLLLMRYRTNR